jgi:hypothetical protein
MCFSFPKKELLFGIAPWQFPNVLRSEIPFETVQTIIANVRSLMAMLKITLGLKNQFMSAHIFTILSVKRAFIPYFDLDVFVEKKRIAFWNKTKLNASCVASFVSESFRFSRVPFLADYDQTGSGNRGKLHGTLVDC